MQGQTTRVARSEDFLRDENKCRKFLILEVRRLNCGTETRSHNITSFLKIELEEQIEQQRPRQQINTRVLGL